MHKPEQYNDKRAIKIFPLENSKLLYLNKLEMPHSGKLNDNFVDAIYFLHETLRLTLTLVS